jgi:hypothetical protein
VPGQGQGQQPGNNSPGNAVGLSQSATDQQQGRGVGGEQEEQKKSGGTNNLIYVIPLPSSLRGQMGRGPADTRILRTDPSPANAQRAFTGRSPADVNSRPDKLTPQSVPEKFKRNVKEYFQPRKK